MLVAFDQVLIYSLENNIQKLIHQLNNLGGKYVMNNRFIDLEVSVADYY